MTAIGPFLATRTILSSLQAQHVTGQHHYLLPERRHHLRSKVLLKSGKPGMGRSSGQRDFVETCEFGDVRAGIPILTRSSQGFSSRLPNASSGGSRRAYAKWQTWPAGWDTTNCNNLTTREQGNHGYCAFAVRCFVRGVFWSNS
jgi:hypothetical protein